MFENSNRVRFERPVDDAGRLWWLEAFHIPFGLTPEAMGDMLTRSVADEKAIIYRFIDGEAHSFALRVEGRFRDSGDVWFVERSLHLDGSVFSADQMFVPSRDAQAGRGRLLMADLLRAAELLGVARISIEAERIGRYAWLRIGFVPDRGSWRNIQLEALRFVQRHQAQIGADAPTVIATLASGGPITARWLAELDHPVPSRELYDGAGQPMLVPFGKAFYLEAAPNWTGEFNFDPESRRLALSYAGSHGREKEKGDG